MYDAIEDPYTSKNSTVPVNKLDLRGQAELDAFEAEISNARAKEPLPDGASNSIHYKAVPHHLFRTPRISRASHRKERRAPQHPGHETSSSRRRPERR